MSIGSIAIPDLIAGTNQRFIPRLVRFFSGFCNVGVNRRMDLLISE
jgi:hypothetical protein